MKRLVNFVSVLLKCPRISKHYPIGLISDFWKERWEGHLGCWEGVGGVPQAVLLVTGPRVWTRAYLNLLGKSTTQQESEWLT